MSPSPIIDRPVRDRLGEGPHWVARLGRLFWVDIMAPRLWSLSLEDGRIESWDMPEAIGWITERAGRDDFLIGLKSGFATLSLDPFTITPLLDPEPDRPGNRLNDAKVDAAGRLWAGSKDDADLAASGALYRLDPDLTLSRQDDRYQVTNGPAFSLDGRTLYHTDSGARTIYAFDLADDGVLTNKRPFIRFEEAWGYPDGMTVDADGGLWVAHWAGGCISRFDPQGKRERSIPLPASNITSCAFAGPDLDRLFVTSASLGAEEERHAGCLFEIDPGTRGVPQPAFAG